MLFRRTALTGPLPEPERGADISELRALMNVGDDSWPLVVGWLVAALLPGIPHPVMLLGGEQGAGKTTAARLLAGVVDPGPALLRSPPREPEQWALAAAGSWLVVVDNVSTIPVWWSDALCKAVTGDGWIRRRLYTDGELSVVSFRRVIALTSIDAGALRGDLGDRLLLVDLGSIDERRRRAETDIDGRYTAVRARLFGALLDLVGVVLKHLPDVKLVELPRMADFARVLAAMDSAIGTDALAQYRRQRGRIAGDVVEADSVGAAIVSLVASASEWSGTAAELDERIKPERPPSDWPKSPRALAGHVRRLTVPLRTVGVEILAPAPTDKTRRYTLRRTALTARPPEVDVGGRARAVPGRAVGDVGVSDSPRDRPTDNGPGVPGSDVPGRLGGSGGHAQSPSEAGQDGGSNRGRPATEPLVGSGDALGTPAATRCAGPVGAGTGCAPGEPAPLDVSAAGAGPVSSEWGEL